jgi:hypothetical protein
MQMSEVTLMELSDEDLLLVSGGANFTLGGPVRFGGTIGGGSTVVAANGTITANAAPIIGVSFGGVTTGNVTITT